MAVIALAASQSHCQKAHLRDSQELRIGSRSHLIRTPNHEQHLHVNDD